MALSPQTFLSTAQQKLLPSVGGLLRGGTLVAGVEVTVLLNETHNLTAQATKQALESGAQVTDHVIIAPASVTIGWEISNAGEGAMAAKDVFETFKTMLEARDKLELITEHFFYDNMVIVAVSPAHEAPYKGRLRGVVTLQQISEVQLETVGRVPIKIGKNKTMDVEIEGGQQETKPPNKSMRKKIEEKAEQAVKRLL